jgi:hypothetical protein
MDPNIDPTTQPQPDRQYWDGDKPVEHDTAELAQPSAVEVLQRKIAFLQGAVVAVIATCVFLVAHGLTTRESMNDRFATLAQAVNTLDERANRMQKRIVDLEEFEADTLDYVSDLEAEIAALNQ